MCIPFNFCTNFTEVLSFYFNKLRRRLLLLAQLSKVFKAAGRLRIRHSRRPDVTFVQEQVERAVGVEGAVGRLVAGSASVSFSSSSFASSLGGHATAAASKPNTATNGIGSKNGGGSASKSAPTTQNNSSHGNSDAQKLWESLCECRNALRTFVIATRDPLGGPPTLPPGECWALLEK